MYKNQKGEKKMYPTKMACSLLSPPTNPKPRPKHFINSGLPKFKPVNLYSTYLSPMQNDKNFSVKTVTSPDDKLNQDLMNKFSNASKNLNSKIFQSPNSTNSDLMTMASLTTQQSNESILSNNTNTSTYIPTTFQPMVPNNYAVCQFPGHRYNYSMVNNQMGFFYGTTTNPFLNGNYANMSMKFNNRQQNYMSNKPKKNNQNVVMNNNNTMSNNNKFKKNCMNNNYIKNKNVINNDKIEISNFNSNNSVKSGSGSEKNSSSNEGSSKGSSNGNNYDMKNDKKSNGSGTGQKKKFFNKFNNPKENCTNENTVILTLKIKVAPNDFRTFNLKKYDDLFISLEKFFDLNKINQELVKPIVTKIFAALNKIFWLLNNKIGNYDKEYLDSLHKLWIKNNEQLPKRSQSKDDHEETKSNDSNEEPNGENKKRKESSKGDKSTISSSDSSDGNKKHKKLMSNSFQNMDNSSDDGKEDTVKSI